MSSQHLRGDLCKIVVPFSKIVIKQHPHKTLSIKQNGYFKKWHAVFEWMYTLSIGMVGIISSSHYRIWHWSKSYSKSCLYSITYNCISLDLNVFWHRFFAPESGIYRWTIELPEFSDLVQIFEAWGVISSLHSCINLSFVALLEGL